MSEAQNPLPEQELLDYAERLGRFGYAGRVVLYLQFSILRSMYQRPDYLRIAMRIFANQIAPFGGRYFRLSNDDVVYVARDASNADLDHVTERVRQLFSEDPSVSLEDTPQPFFTRFDLSSNYGAFLQMCRQRLEQAMARQREAMALDHMVLRPDDRPMTLEGLWQVEEILPMMDVGSVIRKQTVCALSNEQLAEPIFDEVYVSIADLRTLTCTAQNPLSNRWLFQYLTQQLDRLVINHVLREDVHHVRPISLNLNVGTILTPEFQRFNEEATQRIRQSLVIEFNKVDVFADMGAFLFVRDYLRECGFRICLDGLTHLTAPYYDRRKLGFDLIKINWFPDSLNNLQNDIAPVIQRLIKETDQARVILCHCDSQVALTLGRTLGIVMFQGREIDRILSRKRNAL